MRRQPGGASGANVPVMNRISEREKRATAEGAHDLSDQRILSMRADGLTGSSVQTVLRKRIDELAQAIRDKDLERLLDFYAPDVVAFDLRPPLDVRGAGAYRTNFERWFASFEGPLGFELHNLKIVPGDGAAFCHYLGLVTGKRPDDRVSGYWVRGTTCFERRDGQWLVTHEHISIPGTM
jgi:ketosteroid isomerase-like protein